MLEFMAGAFGAKTAVVALWFAALFAAERFRPADVSALPLHGASPPGMRRLLRNGALWAVNLALSPLIVLPVTAFAANHALWRPPWWSGLPGLALDVLVLDFLIYWWHRANHEVPILWRFHSVHHLDETLDTTTAVRFHFGEVLLSALARAGVILVIGFPLSSVLVFETLVLMAALFHHSNLALPAGAEAMLSRIVITPSIHWVHHHAIKRDTDSNYGTVFSFWDPLFRSKSRARRELGMTIGVEGRAEETLPRLILHPFAAA
jgi:sterol desaturase/sphingolipid hydroxylase (fatty acid hydroxylase superfamily)